MVQEAILFLIKFAQISTHAGHIHLQEASFPNTKVSTARSLQGWSARYLCKFMISTPTS